MGSGTASQNNPPLDFSAVVDLLRQILDATNNTTTAISNNSRVVQDMATRAARSAGTKAPLDAPTAAPVASSFDSRYLFSGLQSMLASFANTISAARPAAAENDYRIGQMSRRYLDNSSMSLNAYRQRISNLQMGTGMDMNEAIQFTNISGRFSQGTRRNPANSFDQANQTEFSARMAFSLGADRSNYMTALNQLGRAGAVGGGGRAGGFAQDQRQFAITIAETLASGKLFDRLDDVMQSMGSLATEMASRGGDINTEGLARAIASANEAAKQSGSARLQERAPEVLGNISRTTSAQAQALDPMLIAAYTKVVPKSGPGFGAKDIIRMNKAMQGSDVETQSQVFIEMFRRNGGNIRELANGNDITNLSTKSSGALVRMAQQRGMTTDQLADTLRIAQGVGSQAGGQRLRALQESGQYQSFKQGAEAGAVGLYTRIATGERGDIEQALGAQIESLSKKPLDKEAKTLLAQLTQQQAALKQGADTDTVRSSVMKTIETNKASKLFGAENPLEASKVQTQELNKAFADLASNVNQINGALGTDRTRAAITNALGGPDPTAASAPGYQQGIGGLVQSAASYIPAAVSIGLGAYTLGKGKGWGARNIIKSLTGSAIDTVAHSDYEDKESLSKKASDAAIDHMIGQLTTPGSGGSRFFGPAKRFLGKIPGAQTVGKIAGSGVGKFAGRAAGVVGAALGAYELGSDLYGAYHNYQEGKDQNWGRMLAGGLGAGAGILALGLSTGGVGLAGAGIAGTAGYGLGTQIYDWFAGTPEEQAAKAAGGGKIVGGGDPEGVDKTSIDVANIQELRVARMIVEMQQVQNGGIDFSKVGGGNPSGMPGRGTIDPRTGLPTQSGSVTAPSGSGRSSGSGGVGGADLSQYEAEIQEAAKIAGVDPAYIRAIIRKESGGNAAAVGDNGKSFGLGQIQLETARGIDQNITRDDLLDARKNILMIGRVLLNKKGGPNGRGTLFDQIRGYNGSGPDAEAYARDIMATVRGGGGSAAPGSGGGNPFGAGANIETTSYFGQTTGYTNLTGNPWNRGTDFAGAGKDPIDIFAPVSGTVEKVFNSAADTGDKSGQEAGQSKINSGWGNQVVIRSADGVIHRLSHLANVADLKVGQQISQGARLGRMGATGNTTGRHLDWEIERNGVLYDANEYLKTGQLQGGRNAKGQLVGGVGGGSVSVSGGGSAENSKVEIHIKLTQDKNGNIVGKIQNPENLVLDFSNKDRFAQRWSAPLHQ